MPRYLFSTLNLMFFIIGCNLKSVNPQILKPKINVTTDQSLVRGYPLCNGGKKAVIDVFIFIKVKGIQRSGNEAIRTQL